MQEKKGRKDLQKQQSEVIIKIGNNRMSKLKHVVRSYMEIGFKDFNMIDLAGYSEEEWKDRKYPVPKGYKHGNSKIHSVFKKIGKT